MRNSPASFPTPAVRRPTRALLLAAPLAAVAAAATGCLHVKTDPVEVKPIHIVADINVNIKVERQLEDFFAFQDKLDSPATQPAASQPAAVSMSPQHI